MADIKDILSVGANIASALSNPISSILNYSANKDLVKQSNAAALAQWNRENQYNLPVNQVQRLLSAGLNPALMYDNGSAGLVSAASPELSTPEANFQGMSPQSVAQIEYLDELTREKKIQNDINEPTIDSQQDSIRKINSILGQQHVTEEWRSRYMHMLGDSEYYKSGVYFNEWMEGYKTLSSRIATILSSNETQIAKNVYDRQMTIPAQASMSLEQAQRFGEMLDANIRQAEAMIRSIMTSTRLAGYNAYTARMHARASKMQGLASLDNAWTNRESSMAGIDEVYARIGMYQGMVNHWIRQDDLTARGQLLDVGSKFVSTMFNFFQ